MTWCFTKVASLKCKTPRNQKKVSIESLNFLIANVHVYNNPFYFSNLIGTEQSIQQSYLHLICLLSILYTTHCAYQQPYWLIIIPTNNLISISFLQLNLIYLWSCLWSTNYQMTPNTPSVCEKTQSQDLLKMVAFSSMVKMIQ